MKHGNTVYFYNNNTILKPPEHPQSPQPLSIRRRTHSHHHPTTIPAHQSSRNINFRPSSECKTRGNSEASKIHSKRENRLERTGKKPTGRRARRGPSIGHNSRRVAAATVNPRRRSGALKGCHKLLTIFSLRGPCVRVPPRVGRPPWACKSAISCGRFSVIPWPPYRAKREKPTADWDR